MPKSLSAIWIIFGKAEIWRCVREYREKVFVFDSELIKSLKSPHFMGAFALKTLLKPGDLEQYGLIARGKSTI
ncbi:MAG: hypothetical protein LBG46_04290 [Elusimicrobiota bacterium]|nr:hypothetical protein [Elusimicrobiota bacterium]